MKNKKKSANTSFESYLVLLEVIFGLVLLAAVFWSSSQRDIERAEENIYEKVTYVKEQCDNYTSLNLASEARGLMRVIQSANQVAEQLKYEKDLTGRTVEDQKLLEEAVQDNYLTGILLLDRNGVIQSEYFNDDRQADEMEEELANTALLEVAEYPEKSYSARISLTDGSYVDLAASKRLDEDGVVVVYYHTSAEYAEKFTLTFPMLLDGYSIEKDGRIVITSGDQIIASNDNELVGKSVDDIPILSRLKESEGGAHLLHSRGDSNRVTRDFGMLERGRNYYVYAYLSEQEIFSRTPRNILYVLFFYLFCLAVFQMARRNLSQVYQKKQVRMQEEYTKELQSKNAQLESAIRREKKANAAKTNFLSRMTHDIRTPLNGIIGLLKIDEAHPDDQELIESNRKKMMVSADHLLSLINDMLQMSKLEDEEVVLAHEAINLKDLSKDIQVIVGQRAAEAGVTMEFDPDSDYIAHPYIYGSPLHIRQLFLNIYGNCIKYNKVGGKVRTSFKNLKTEEKSVLYQWEISDTGIGMNEEFLKHIFDPFSQEHSDARSVYNGTGLGMAIVKKLLDKMGGTIEIESKEGEGSTFRITLPFERAKEEEVEPQKTIQESDVTIRGLHFLLAEDNELNAEIAQMLLEDEGAQVTLARNGQEAMDLFGQNPEGTFDAILMDIMMPLVDGYSATRAIRSMKRPDAKTIPILAMTANAFDEDAKQCFEAGMNAHLSKPLQMEVVVETIAKYCKKK